jgi:hypothetical protein
MKLTTQLVVLVLGTLMGMIALVVCLAIWASWSDGAIVGMVSAFGTIAAGVLVAVRNQAKTADVLDAQDRKLDTVVAQTNGLSERERQDIADRAAVAVAKMYRNGEL